LQCTFATVGFEGLRPCRSAYHVQCFRVGPPFASRRKGGEGLCFPPVDDWPQFICEACTVRAVQNRELVGPYDIKLMMLERMRILDMVSYWSKGTHSSYQGKLRVIRDFEDSFGVSILRPTPLLSPPKGPEIALMWCQEAYSLRPSSKRFDRDVALNLAFTTVRQLRAAASQYLAWDMLVSQPEVFLTRDRHLLAQPCRPTDTYGYTLFTKGMVARLGDETRPSTALLDGQVRFLDTDLNQRYLASSGPVAQRELALAGLANLTLWLGWLRTSECFGLEWADCSILEPVHGPRLDLPPGCGLVSFRLGPETKSERTKRPSLLLAYRTLSGLCVGKWAHRARVTSAPSVGPIFRHLDGAPWTSRYFRDTYLYPSLSRQQALGDPYLVPFDGSPGNSIAEKFWSLHCYRRGARSHVSRGGKFGRHRFKKATSDQVYEHARWRYKRSSEPIDVMYREWTPLDRVKLTLYCH
jgi:hypothetical protein